MNEIFELADKFVSEQAELDPISATFEGIAGHDNELTDYSPEGYAKRADFTRSYLERGQRH